MFEDSTSASHLQCMYALTDLCTKACAHATHNACDAHTIIEVPGHQLLVVTGAEELPVRHLHHGTHSTLVSAECHGNRACMVGGNEAANACTSSHLSRDATLAPACHPRCWQPAHSSTAPATRQCRCGSSQSGGTQNLARIAWELNTADNTFACTLLILNARFSPFSSSAQTTTLTPFHIPSS